MNEGFAKAIAIDYDGCIAINSWPGIGEPNWEVINRAKEEQAKGAKLILWTCREGHKLEEAVKASQEWGLSFDAVNDNLPELKEDWGNNPRKIAAAEYWDDRAVRIPPAVTMNVFDKEETYPNCSVQILTNTITGEQSIGWWKNKAEWISVEDRLPEMWKSVLVVRGTAVHLDFLGRCPFTGKVSWEKDIRSGQMPVTHWMPLPEPPKEG